MNDTTTPSTQLALSKANEQQSLSVFSNSGSFEQAQRFANALCKSDIVPLQYRNNIPNTLVALEMANRMGESPLMVMQHLDIIHGKPSFSSKFVIGRLNTCGRFTPLRYRYTGEGDARQCVAYAQDTRTGEVLEGTAVSIQMAKKEGWFNKQGSKWLTMPDLMLMYRSATFFGRMYAPELTMGMQTTDELQDVNGYIMAAPSPTVQPIVAAGNDAVLELNENAAGKRTKRTPKNVAPTAEPMPENNGESTVPNHQDELM